MANRQNAPDREHLAPRERRIEGDVRGEPRRAELGDALAKRLGRDVVLVVAEDGMRDADHAHALDHAAAGIEAREDARPDEVAGERHEEVENISKHMQSKTQDFNQHMFML